MEEESRVIGKTLRGGTVGLHLDPSCGGSDNGLWGASSIIIFFPHRVAVAEALSLYCVLCKNVYVRRGGDRFEVCGGREAFYCKGRLDVQISGAAKKTWEGGGTFSILVRVAKISAATAKTGAKALSATDRVAKEREQGRKRPRGYIRQFVVGVGGGVLILCIY